MRYLDFKLLQSTKHKPPMVIKHVVASYLSFQSDMCYQFALKLRIFLSDSFNFSPLLGNFKIRFTLNLYQIVESYHPNKSPQTVKSFRTEKRLQLAKGFPTNKKLSDFKKFPSDKWLQLAKGFPANKKLSGFKKFPS